ncbi:MAG TPA: glycosyltransferase family 2 protein [Vicinamibacterales bacterium]|jgi:hypothetical protein
MTDLAIIVVSYNAKADLLRMLESLLAPPPQVTHEVVVVDNGSADGSLAAVREQWPRVTAIDAGGNLGFSRANNIGIRATRSEFILLLNSDTLVAPGVIDRLVAVLRGLPDTAIVGPRLVDAAGVPEISFGRMMSPWNELRQKTLGRLYDAGVGFVRRFVARQVRTAHVVDWVSGACLLVRRQDAEAVGLLDERFFLYTEDIDFCASVRQTGRRVRFTPEAEIRHLRGRSRAHAPGPAEIAYRRSHLAFYAKHHPRWYPMLRVYLRAKGALPPQIGPGEAGQ